MPSSSFQQWSTDRSDALNEIERAHVAVGGTKRGRRYATQQINQAYAVLLASQFQGFCRNLYDEAVVHLVAAIAPQSLQVVAAVSLNRDRKLDRGNAQPGSIGSDFDRLGIDFWTEVKVYDPRNTRRQSLLDELNVWRNAIAHQDFDRKKLGGTTSLKLSQVRLWRKACGWLALTFDEITRRHLHGLTGTLPW